jgi:hypothetical protein
VARRSTPRAARASRKRRRSGAASQGAAASSAAKPTAPAPASAAKATPSAPAGTRSRQRRAQREAALERPQAPWHPLPLSELVILVGMIAVIIGASRGESGLTLIVIGLAAVLIGTLDFTIREHFTGYRSHAALLAALPTALLHGLLAIAMLALGAPSPSWVVVPLIVDVPVFLVLYRFFRGRFRDARRERMFAAGG